MPNCEMCGYIGEDMHRAIVEGTILLLCDKCVKFGEVIQLKNPSKDLVDKRLEYYRTHRYSSQVFPTELREEDIIVKDYASRIKMAREKTGKTQEEIALDIAEKGSVLQKIESGHAEPSLKLARKLEQYFRIQLVQKAEKLNDEDIPPVSSSGAGFTIGDVIKLKK